MNDRAINGKETNLHLAQLSKLFYEFRKNSPSSHPRIPEVLRLKALAARRQGIPSNKIAKICGLSAYQLTLWDQKYR